MKKNPQIMNNEIESQSGYSKVPLGKAGPLKLFGSYARGEFILPLATSEITLVASVNRGCKVTKLSGGIKTYVLKDTITRTPLYRTADVSSALKLSKFIKENLGILKEIAGSTTNHGELIKTEEWVIGNLVFVRFHLSPGDAMGMHMITIAVDEISKYKNAVLNIKFQPITGFQNCTLQLAWGRSKKWMNLSAYKEKITEF